MRGFTLIEILLVIALIGMLMTLVVINIGSILRGGVSRDTPADVVREAVREARFISAREKRPVSLRYDAGSRSLRIEESQSEVPLREFQLKLGGVEGDGSRAIRFFVQAAQEGFPRGEPPVWRGDALPVSGVAFTPDSGGSRFEVLIEEGGTMQRIRFDAFSHVELEVADDA